MGSGVRLKRILDPNSHLIHSLGKFLLGGCCVLGTVLGMGGSVLTSIIYGSYSIE